MGSYFGQFGQALGQTMLAQQKRRHPIAAGILQQYLSNRHQGPPVAPPPNPPGAVMPPAPPPQPQDFGPMGPPDAGPNLVEPEMPMENLAGGTLVTKPTIARLAEDGNAEMVVPLTPRPGNKLQPDMLEGRLSNPKIPGVRYQRYKSFNRFGPGSGGQV